MIEGFDASGWSGDIDFVGAKAAGKQFGYFRVGRGKPDGATDSYGIDKLWVSNYTRAGRAGLICGGYWRFFPDVDMNSQVNSFTQNLYKLNGQLPPLLDIEDTGGLGPTELTDWVIACARQIWHRTGRKPLIYTGKSFYDTRLEYWRLHEWELCIAWDTVGKWREYGAIFWQYKLDMPVPWATGRVDLQRFALNNLGNHLFENELLYHFDEDGLLHGPLVYSDKLLPESGQQGTQPNYITIIHTMVGYLNGTDSYFRRGDVSLESTLGVGGKYDGEQLDGAIYQWMRIQDRADANYNANAYAASIETSDGGGNRYLEPWSEKQAESLAQISAAWCLFYNRPPVLVSRARQTERGLGHHRQGTDPWRLPGDDYWSPEGHRACPGETRIKQLSAEVIPRTQKILDSLDRTTSPVKEAEEPDMQLTEVVGKRSDGTEFTVKDVLADSYLNSQFIQREAAQLPVDLQEKFHALCNLLYTLHGQATWKDLEQYTWADLASKKWALLK